MVATSTAAGVFMYAVHLFARKMPEAEYGVLGTLLQIVNLMAIPSIGLQGVFAQQTAAAMTEAHGLQLRATVRAVLAGTCLLWFTMAGVILAAHDRILGTLKIADPTALWVTAVIGLAQLWLPVMLGLLQGRQNFLWLGWAALLNGMGRFAAVAVVVGLVSATAAGVMAGVFAGMASAFACAAWHGRSAWLGPAARFEAGAWLRRVLPLTLGLGASQFMLSADMIVVQALFEKETTGLYVAAGMIGRALVFFTVPMTAVMFPKIVASAARAERTPLLGQALGATALLGGLGALFLTLFPRLPLLIVQGERYAPIAWLIPWFAWCMLPLTLANVLINNLLAREQFRVVPWLLIVAVGYATALSVFNDTFLVVVGTLGVFSLLLFLVSACFTWPLAWQRWFQPRG
jgi:O-antigen/teichoic acid export membrane protein